jgi:hypothetical protein
MGIERDLSGVVWRRLLLRLRRRGGKRQRGEQRCECNEMMHGDLRQRPFRCRAFAGKNSRADEPVPALEVFAKSL